MKKHVITIIVLFFLFSLTANTRNSFDPIGSKNVTKMNNTCNIPQNCYQLITDEPLAPAWCCEPWFWICWVFDEFHTNGWPEFHQGLE